MIKFCKLGRTVVQVIRINKPLNFRNFPAYLSRYQICRGPSLGLWFLWFY
ncbi:unnamed protein product [Tenebrio molitor]|nr:unnamed protein product [Tenebrio molitor]